MEKTNPTTTFIHLLRTKKKINIVKTKTRKKKKIFFLP
jgi:hypothetical protein